MSKAVAATFYEPGGAEHSSAGAVHCVKKMNKNP